MSLQALTAYLSIQKPGHTIDSAYALEQKYRLAAATVISQLQSHGYKHTVLPSTPSPTSSTSPTPPTRKVWLKQETQLDRIERRMSEIERHLTALGKLLPSYIAYHSASQFAPSSYFLTSAPHVQS